MQTEIPFFHSFKNDITFIQKPEKFTYPFCYEPHPLSIQAAQELQEAERLAHTIKGLAGSLGAEELVQASAALESAFKNS